MPAHPVSDSPQTCLERLRAALDATPPDELVTLLMLVRQTSMPLALAAWLDLALLGEMDAQAGRCVSVPNPARVIDATDAAKSVLVLATLATKLKQSGLARASQLAEAAAECLQARPLLH